ncbi:phage portal protein [Aurantimonas sp. 22II-16-19i]|uniref:phage portal protein n=1 Tax=Aurantimonas sp. 22II-16-19i TaxID=1317114 RepID=UPI0009F7C1C0|nr:phage portal protein [Aurantimonas sp. 22II-16-19i]ORE90990.1 capsid protein of prophage [Aurantimonas sp. 22II-16-19i]
MSLVARIRQSVATAIAPARPAPEVRPTMRYLRDTGSAVLTSRWASLPDSRRDIQWAWDRAAALAADFIHNSGRLKGAVDQVKADTVGTELKLNAQPDVEALGWTKAERSEWKRLVEREWRQWSWNPAECDHRGKFTIPQIVDMSLGHHVAFGEACGALGYMPAATRQRYNIRTGLKVSATSPVHLVRDTNEFEGLHQGVVLDENDRPQAYRLRISRGGLAETQDYAARDQFGSALFYHVFDPKDPHDVRGISELAPVMKTWAMSEKLDDATLQTAVLQTVFAATLTSPEPSAAAFEALEALKDVVVEGTAIGTELVGDFCAAMKARLDQARESRVAISDSQINHLGPGEEFKFHSAETPGNQYLPFSMHLQRIMARCIGVTFSSFTLDHTNATYSSVRMENASIWPVVMRRRERIAAPICQAIYEAWLTESVVEKRIPFKGGVAAFMANREKACWAEWVGPPAPTADDKKSAQAATERLANRTSSLAIESAAVGYDPQDIAAMRAEDIKLYEGLGMADPYLPIDAALSRSTSDDPVGAPANG